MKPPIVRAMYAPKDGCNESEWEDAAGYSERRGLVAVADGASSSYRAGRWSSALVEAFLNEPPDLRCGHSAFGAWVASASEAFQRDSESISDTSWYASDASRRGSFATFCGLRLQAKPTPELRAVHVGDACLFHCRGDDLVMASIDDPSAFDSTPALLSSVPYEESHGAENAQFSASLITPGDVVFLTSDALGAAMLRLAAVEQPVWSFFAQVGQKGFARAVSRLRTHGVMEDDDVTMVRVRTRGKRS